VPSGIPHLRDAIAELEMRWIKQALVETRGNRSEAAKLLGISRAALYARIDEYGIAD
jgi:DNA-binding NtrC family response regulator